MSDTKFTKGPWVVGKPTGDSPFCVDANCNNDGELFELCMVLGVDEFSEACEQSKANANLIAAAPEMYEMLERFLPHSTFDSDGNEVFHGGEFNWNEDDDPMIDELKLLLAKARGES